MHVLQIVDIDTEIQQRAVKLLRAKRITLANNTPQLMLKREFELHSSAILISRHWIGFNTHSNFLKRYEVGVLHSVVQQASYERLVVHLELCQDARNLHGMRNVRLSRFAVLPTV